MSLDKSIHAHSSRPESKFFQVASIALTEGSNELTVENRTLVFRGFASNSNNLVAVTHQRSDKYKQWQDNPQSQICWYFTQSREQYRITSTVHMIGKDAHNLASVNHDIRERVWEELSDAAKAQFSWPLPKRSINETNPKIEFDNNDIPNTFIVLIFTPSLIDYLNISENPQIRELHKMNKKSGKWTFASVNP